MRSTLMVILAAAVSVSIPPAIAGKQEAIEGCKNQIRAVGGPDASNGIDFWKSSNSGGNYIILLRDAGGTVWRCVAKNSGAVRDLNVVQGADDGGGAMAGAPGEPTTTTQRVRFNPGNSSASLRGQLTPGSSARYALSARSEQFLSVRFSGAAVSYQIFNPDNSFLLDQIQSSTPYRGQLWQTGDHVVEVINRSNRTVSYTVTLGVQ